MGSSWVESVSNRFATGQLRSSQSGGSAVRAQCVLPHLWSSDITGNKIRLKPLYLSFCLSLSSAAPSLISAVVVTVVEFHTERISKADTCWYLCLSNDLVRLSRLYLKMLPEQCCQTSIKAFLPSACACRASRDNTSQLWRWAASNKVLGWSTCQQSSCYTVRSKAWSPYWCVYWCAVFHADSIYSS